MSRVQDLVSAVKLLVGYGPKNPFVSKECLLAAATEIQWLIDELEIVDSSLGFSGWANQRGQSTLDPATPTPNQTTLTPLIL